jgi:Sap, sulfolipid-1-addressing protein
MRSMGDLGGIFVFALLAAVNPTLLTATTVMMLLPDTKRLMFGYLLGAYLTSISTGLVVVFTLHNSDSVETARRTLSPVQDLVFGAILLIVAFVLGTGRVEELRERRRRHKEAEDKGPKKEPWPQRMLGKGSARVSFAVGALLSFPGASYLVGLDRIADLDAAAAPSVLLVLTFCLIQQSLLEIPLIGYALAPERTQRRVEAFRDWLARNGRRAAAIVATTLGTLLVVRGVVELIAR